MHAAWEEGRLHEVLQDAFAKPWGSRQLAVLNQTEGVETVAQVRPVLLHEPCGLCPACLPAQPCLVNRCPVSLGGGPAMCYPGIRHSM